ncbi:unnamed protein product [Gulo gulo]|uniref:Uncharacterized protein n=1 Tax=Gulo gulo TaxID=48420 RepID=A0A9X9M8H6_GULGU|nr:unnamed protein product [Gulo gulo]
MLMYGGFSTFPTVEKQLKVKEKKSHLEFSHQKSQCKKCGF